MVQEKQIPFPIHIKFEASTWSISQSNWSIYNWGMTNQLPIYTNQGQQVMQFYISRYIIPMHSGNNFVIIWFIEQILDVIIMFFYLPYVSHDVSKAMQTTYFLDIER